MDEVVRDSAGYCGSDDAGRENQIIEVRPRNEQSASDRKTENRKKPRLVISAVLSRD